MKMQESEVLRKAREKIRELIGCLKDEYEYVSVLATDTGGERYLYSSRNKAILPYDFGERGFVLRAYKNGGYQEYSFNEIEDVKELAQKIRRELSLQEQVLKDLKVEKYPTPLLYEEEITRSFLNEDFDSVHETSKEEIMGKLKAISEKGFSYENIIECQATYTHVVINKMFISEKKDMVQAYGYSLASFMLLALKDGQTFYNGKSASGFKGLEILEEILPAMDKTYSDLMAMFGAENLVPGEYEVILTPEAAGIVAHEAFGHGLEMDMFVKNRAVAKKHMQEQIGSGICNMYDGTTEVNDTATYAFDDEGTVSGLTTILDKGVLKSGMNDALSALRLQVKPSGNGRRESYKRKAYTRMTNTYFGTGDDSLEDMIQSISYGFLIDGASNGMEDPKNWGIQCVFDRAWEIKNGKLTGKLFTPVYLTGYVPDLLANISMCSAPLETNGNGFCGKGYKEWVVVSDGGPYLKTKVRLG